MASRQKLHEELTDILGNGNCYFQPPESVKLKYPCIIYSSDTIDTQYADDHSYILVVRYDVTFITKNPDSEVPFNLLRHFEQIKSDRNFTSDNLHHYTFNLYY